MKNISLETIIGIGIGVIGIILSIYFYYQAQRHIEAAFIVDPIRTEILSINRISDTPITVIKANGERVNNDLTSVRFYFWNNGNESIRKENILKPIKLTVDVGVDILDFKVLKLSRDITGITLTRNNDINNCLDISFSILEPRDGFTGQILLDGKKDSSLSISGIIEHTHEIITNSMLVQHRLWPVYLKTRISLLFAAFLVMISHKLTELISKYSDILESKLHSGFIKLVRIVFLTCVASGIAFFVVTLFIEQFKDAEKEAEHSIVSVVPIEILPDK